MSTYPKSAFEQVGGIYYFPRMLDKIRLHARGELSTDYHALLGTPQSGDDFCCSFLRVNYEELKARTLAGSTDEEVFAWCCEQGRKPNDFDRMIFNAFLKKLGWNDFGTSHLRRLKEKDGLAGRDDIQTVMEYFEVDEGRKP